MERNVYIRIILMYVAIIVLGLAIVTILVSSLVSKMISS